MPNCAANRYPSITSFTSSKKITRLTVISVRTRAQTGSRLESDWPKNLTDRAFTGRFKTDRDKDSNDMLDCFDFDRKPLDPVVITPETKLDFSDLVTTQP
jgi:hypothetical protein